YENCFGHIVSHTTRKPRLGEVNNKDYYFIESEQMISLIKEDKFIEYAHVHGNYYGTSKSALQFTQNQGKICVLDIDVQGCERVKLQNIPSVYIFISPPDINTLKNRLQTRSTESEDSIKLRLENAQKEMEYTNIPNFFDKIIVNDNLDIAFEELKQFMGPYIEIQKNKGIP
ncbi:hypothetical protein DLAC_04010, partial [Tieghemostelium lacteum]